MEYLQHPLETRQLYLDQIQADDYTGVPHLYDSEQGFMDRMDMLAYDDALIAFTDKGNVYGLGPIWANFLNVIPHFIWKEKPIFPFGNAFAHEIGVLSEDDTTTGISFGPVADAYHEAQWFGVLVVLPPIIFLYFFVTESLTGSVRETPYALLPIALAAHAAPEGLLAAPLYMATIGAVLLIVIAFMSKYVLAHFTRLAMGGDRTRVQITQSFFPDARAFFATAQARAARPADASLRRISAFRRTNVQTQLCLQDAAKLRRFKGLPVLWK